MDIEYVSALEFARLHGKQKAWIIRLCLSGRIRGAHQGINGVWAIPKDAALPTAGRPGPVIKVDPEAVAAERRARIEDVERGARQLRVLAQRERLEHDIATKAMPPESWPRDFRDLAPYWLGDFAYDSVPKGTLPEEERLAFWALLEDGRAFQAEN